MTFLLFHTFTPKPLVHFSTFPNLSCSLKPKTSIPTPRNPTSATIPARDRVIEFGKHKGKMLGTLPSTYLKWVSKNLRARDFEEWAKLADQVLQDPVYNDRVEWEFAENVLNGNKNSSLSRNESAVSELLEISERFGWDNKDKAGWSRVDFELLGTSKGGRIPRILPDNHKGGEERELGVKKREKVEGLLQGGQRRRERRERLRLKKKEVEMEEDKLGIIGKSRGGFGNGSDGQVRLEMKKGNEQDVYNPFPGREGLLKKVLSRKRFL